MDYFKNTQVNARDSKCIYAIKSVLIQVKSKILINNSNILHLIKL